MSSCIHVLSKLALFGKHPLMYTFAAAPYDVDVLNKPFAAILERNQRHFFHHMHLVLTRDMQIIGITRSASHTFNGWLGQPCLLLDFDQSCSFFVQFHLKKTRLDPPPLVTSPIYIEASYFVFTYEQLIACQCHQLIIPFLRSVAFLQLCLVDLVSPS